MTGTAMVMTRGELTWQEEESSIPARGRGAGPLACGVRNRRESTPPARATRDSARERGGRVATRYGGGEEMRRWRVAAAQSWRCGEVARTLATERAPEFAEGGARAPESEECAAS